MAGKGKTNIFVLLGYGFGADSWRRRFNQGLIPGLNDELPYGYYRANSDDWSVEYSQDREENALRRLSRRSLARLVGFDFIHTWGNRQQLMASDAVWTHTERECLAALLLLRIARPKDPPRIIAQCMWLADRWPRFSSLRQELYTRLLRRADIVITQSPAMLAKLYQILPEVPIECLLSGACISNMKPPVKRPAHNPVRIASVGSDMHRDWTTLIKAFGGIPSFDLRIASGKIPKSHYSNIVIAKAAREDHIKCLYEWADVVVVPLKMNHHISGSTTIFEATVSGKPVVATDTGGLRAYFSDREICYVPISDPPGMRAAVERLANDSTLSFEMATAAQKRLLDAELTTEGCAQRHRELTERILHLPSLTSENSSRSSLSG
ncbi:MAG: glycosyltransferase [Candidatus Binataceae bacterium]